MVTVRNASCKLTSNKIPWKDESKEKKVSSCLEAQTVDLWQLRNLALERGGFVNRELRAKAWMKVLGINRHDLKKKLPTESIIQNEKELIKRDVGRSVYFQYQNRKHLFSSPSSHGLSNQKGSHHPCHEEIDACDAETKLFMMIVSALGRKSGCRAEQWKTHYYQGLHEIASVILFNAEIIVSNHTVAASEILYRISSFHLSNSTRHNDFAEVLSLLSASLMPLIRAFDKVLYEFIEQECNGGEVVKSVVLTWVVTWFAHEIMDVDVISRMFDALLVSHPLFVLYVSVALILHPSSQDRIFAIADYDGGDFEDPSIMLHIVLSGLPRLITPDYNPRKCDDIMPVTVQNLLDIAISIMKRVPLRALPNLEKDFRKKTYQTRNFVSPYDFSKLFKSPSPFWSIASTAPPDWVGDGNSPEQPNKFDCLNSEANPEGTSSIIPLELATNLELRNVYEKAQVASGLGGQLDVGGVVLSPEAAPTTKKGAKGVMRRVLSTMTIFDTAPVNRRKKLKS